MTDASRIADSTMFKIVVPVLQTIISLGAIAAFSYVVSSLSSLQVQLSSYQTSQALIAQRVDSLERSRDSSDKIIDSLRFSDQHQDSQITNLGDSLKNLVLTGRPK
jgi:hypothetical protein